jgi:hypothetical protein
MDFEVIGDITDAVPGRLAMARSKTRGPYLLCVKNADYPASFEVRKVYRSLPDPAAAARGFVRVIDESGEDYLYLSRYFVVVKLPQAAASAFAETS